MVAINNNPSNNPTIEEIIDYLKEYGWNYRVSKTDDGEESVISPILLENGNAVLVTFNISGEFIVVNTVNLFTNVPVENALFFLQLNDEIKSVKAFCGMDDEITSEGTINIDLSFELWEGSRSFESFASFLDLLYFGIEHALKLVQDENIPHDTEFIKFID